MSKHTPGKLRLEEESGQLSLIADDGFSVAAFCIDDDNGVIPPELERANAARAVACWNAMDGIDDPAAARAILDDPRVEAMTDMLEALKLALEQIEPAPKPKLIQTPDFALRMIRAAIAKAEGRS